MAADHISPTTSGLTDYSSTVPDLPRPKSVVIQQQDGSPDYLRLILTSRIYDVLQETPVTPAVNLSTNLGYKVLLKREDLQPVFSFKVRGAYNKMAHLPVEDRWKGVVACSAGNHAQGVAFSAKHLGIPATIVMPLGTPTIKHQNRLELKHGLTNVPPFDDPYVIAGQGTIGMELLRQCDLAELEAVFCCIGGGGLIAGVSVYLKRIAPHIKVIGVETYDANAMVQSLELGKRVTLKEVGLFADGAAVKVVGEETFRLCKKYVDEVIQVSTDEICAAIKDVFQGLDTRSIVEPAGALALAGLKKYAANNPPSTLNSSLCAILSGANMDFDRLRFVAERARLGEGKEVLLSVVVPDKPKVFNSMMKSILPRAVTEFSYRFGDRERAVIFMSIMVQDRDSEIPEILKCFESKGFQGQDISDNELAKSHARYLIGGRLPEGMDIEERLYRFEFPERPGALGKFLDLLNPEFNISLFHYRNHGGDVGKVLVGIQVPPGKKADLDKFLAKLQFPFVDETDSVVYKSFLK
ncbi:tryptophan synthase beta subunit-like PLP-dependent enzyme [Trichophaea hybrida]|nr:tryptophan synthase beta subunit-like PLP-dependent enzyme [Trichophaea hybrida]